MGLFRRNELDGACYHVRERMFSIGDDFWIGTDRDAHAFKVDGKALRLRKTLVVQSPSGDELFTVRERKLTLRDTMAIERRGETFATVKKALVGIRERYTVDLQGDDELKAKGNMVDHEYEVERDGRKIAEISKRWFRIRDSYGIEVAAGEDDALLIAVTICIDQLAHD
jgi:uncharacterized protein YxjI